MKMEEKKYCYRYVDSNDNEGRAVVQLWSRVIIRETEKTFWHVYDFPKMTLEQIRQMHKTPGDKSVKRCLKNAARSGYHLTREEALRAFIYRKAFQFNRMRLSMETVELCLKGLNDAGHANIEIHKDGRQISRWAEVLHVPDCESFLACETPGPVASGYNWGEW